MSVVEGSRVGKYELGEKLGEGEFGVVFAARDVELARSTAMKFLHAQHARNPEIVAWFLQEARSAARLQHPGIVTVFECGKLENPSGVTAFVSMELLHGESLGARCRRGPLPWATAIDIARQIASALEAAHRANIVHRDLEPDNVILCEDPAMPRGERVKILGFGTGKRGVSDPDRTVGAGMPPSFGKPPRYMPSEQCQASTVDHRADVYALGCMLFEIIAGRPVFEGQGQELMAKHEDAVPTPVRQLAPDCPEALEALITQMLAKDPDDRPPTMAVVQSKLTELAPAVSARPQPKRRIGWIVGAVGVVALGGGLAFALTRRGADVPASPSPVASAPADAAVTRLAGPDATLDPPAPLLPTEIIVATSKQPALILVDGERRGRGTEVEVPVTPGDHSVTFVRGDRHLFVQLKVRPGVKGVATADFDTWAKDTPVTPEQSGQKPPAPPRGP